MSDMSAAMAARSLRTIKTELEFLADCNRLTKEELRHIISLLPTDTDPALIQLNTAVANTAISQPQRQPSPSSFPVALPARNDEKAQLQQQQQPIVPYQPAQPPAYTAPPTLSTVTALYAYSATDAGDLPLQVGDTINVTEYVNGDWWRGINANTKATGIFPRAYVKEVAVQKEGYGYGNVPLQVANGVPTGQPVVPAQQQGQQAPHTGDGKGAEMGKKFGKKLGNAAIFGAGATIGGNIVNSIF